MFFIQLRSFSSLFSTGNISNQFIVPAGTVRKIHGREVVSLYRVACSTAYKYLRRIIVLFLVSHCIKFYNICNNYNTYRVSHSVHDIHSSNHSAGLNYCTGLDELMKSLGYEHQPENWRLFIDANKHSLKAGLLYIGNEYPLIPCAFATNMREYYAVIKLWLDKINYKSYEWSICDDFKVIGILLGLKCGYTKHCCFLCTWDSKTTDQKF